VLARSLITRGALSGALIIGSLAGLPRAADASSHRVRVYFLGDSVMAWGVRTLAHELSQNRPPAVIDVASCRGLVRSCALRGKTVRPPSGLQRIRQERGHLGSLVVIELCYNDVPGRWSIGRVMSELRRQHVAHVVWVNLSERRPIYRRTNLALSAARSRWRELRVLNWQAASARHPEWFLDGVHLTRAGKTAFARFVAKGLAQVA
jgi:hypothetical protein